MRSVALILLAALGIFVAWVALRDWRPVDRERIAAQAAAARLNATLLDRRGRNAWRIRMAGPLGARCLEVDTRRFAPDPAHGYRGVQPANCPPP